MDQKLIRIGNIYNDNWGTGLPGNVWDPEGILPTITTCQGGAAANDFRKKKEVMYGRGCNQN
ncbi:MAG: hypothetical protein MJ169_08915 [Treponema sp.]|nr:hypothetical protein [Treponema sp.]